MNGWHRLFVVYAVVVAIILGLKFLSYRPGEYAIGKYAASACGVFRYVSKEDAGTYLKQGFVHNTDYPDVDENAHKLAPKCRADLEEYVSGKSLQTARSSWIKEWPLLVGFYLAILLLTYGIGWVIGWVWRGFRPRKI